MNVYDFDKTIYNGDSTADFYFFCLKRHFKILKCFPSLFCAYFKFYIFRKGTKTQFKEKMYRFLKYADIKKDLDDFWKAKSKNIKDFYIKQKKTDDVIISASPVFLLEPICKQLNVSLIASEVDKKTGKYTGINCHGYEKVRRFHEIYGESKIDCFYSDSYSDTPLAKISDKAYLVRGNKISDWKF